MFIGKYILILAVFLHFSPCAAAGAKEALSKIGLSLNEEIWKIEKDKIGKGKKLQFVTMKLSQSSKFAMVEVIFPLEKELAKKETQVMETVFKNLYKATPVPYKGQISERLACKGIKLPQEISYEISGVSAKAFMAPATKRFVFGECNAKRHFYDGVVTQFYMEPSKALIKIRLFVERNRKVDKESMINSLNSIFK